jgi:hypothetical protein
MSGFVPLSRWVGERAAVATMAPTLKQLIEATQGEELLVAGTASTGPPLIVFWGPFVVGVLMLFGGDKVPALGPAGLAIAGVGVLLGLFRFKPVSVALSDRRLIVFRDTSIRPRRIKGIVLDVPRNDVFVQGFRYGAGWVTLILVFHDSVGRGPMRLIVQMNVGKAMRAALTRPGSRERGSGK